MIVGIGNQSYWTFDGFVTDAHGATYYIATTGSDSNSGSSIQPPSTPRRTTNAAASCLSAGDTLIVKAGTYDEVVIEFAHSHYLNGARNPRRIVDLLKKQSVASVT